MASLSRGTFPVAVRRLDAGAGHGTLAAAFVDRWRADRPDGAALALDAYDLDPATFGALRGTLYPVPLG